MSHVLNGTFDIVEQLTELFAKYSCLIECTWPRLENEGWGICLLNLDLEKQGERIIENIKSLDKEGGRP